MKRAIAYYGLFTPGRGVKVGEHGTGPEVDPDARVDVVAESVHRLEAYVAEWLPGLSSTPVAVDSCLYTRRPTRSSSSSATAAWSSAPPCSGHGFKFVPAIGRRTAELALGTPRDALGLTRPSRSGRLAASRASASRRSRRCAVPAAQVDPAARRRPVLDVVAAQRFALLLLDAVLRAGVESRPQHVETGGRGGVIPAPRADAASTSARWPRAAPGG